MTQATGEQHVFDTIRAVGDVTIAEMLDPQRTTAGGILIPDTVQKSPIWWKVLSVGPKVDNGVKVGDRIVFSSGSRVEHDGRTIVALRPADVLGVMPAPGESPRVRTFDPTKF